MFMGTGQIIVSKCERRQIAESSVNQEILAIGWICIAGNSVPEIGFLAMYKFVRNVYGNWAKYCLKVRVMTFCGQIQIAE